MISRLETVCSKSRRKKSDSDIISSYLSLYIYIQLILKHLYNNKVSFIYIISFIRYKIIMILYDIIIKDLKINIFYYYY